MNTYGYVHQNPLKWTDPLGLLVCTYSITDHRLYCSNNQGESFDTNQNRSGNNEGGNQCKNKASDSCMNTKGSGPVPFGNYTIFSPNQTRHKKGWMFLLPDSGLNSDIRSGLFMHPGSFSEGCITITDKEIFKKLSGWANQDNGGTLIVNP